jgi:hypothetical protein
MIITRPFYGVTSLADALRFDWRGWHLSEKKDGVWTVRQFDGSLVTGEKMRDGRFYAFDIANHEGQDVRQCAWLDRREALIDCAARHGFPLVKQGHGAEFIEAVLRDGGEGCVAKLFCAPFGVDWFKIKRVEAFDVTVTGNVTSAMEIAFEGQPAGKCALFGSNWESVQIGDVVEIVAYRRNVSGKFREPRFLRIRTDK